MANINIGAAVSNVTTLANLPIDKGTVYATLSQSTNLSVASGMVAGQMLRVVCNPTADFDQVIPTTGGYSSAIGDTLKFKSGKSVVLSIDCYASAKYLISYDGGTAIRLNNGFDPEFCLKFQCTSGNNGFLRPSPHATYGRRLSIWYSYDKQTWNKTDYEGRVEFSDTTPAYIKAIPVYNIVSNIFNDWLDISGTSVGCINISGNLLSLFTLVEPEDPDETLSGTSLQYFINHNSGARQFVYDLSNFILPTKHVTKDLYVGMFSGATYMVNSPQILAETVDGNGMARMFEGCQRLQTAPLLKIKSAGQEAFSWMFANCYGLKTVPSGSYICSQGFTGTGTTAPAMFLNCTGLTSIPTDFLPATNLVYGCYTSMFQSCKSLKRGPDLKASNVSENAYNSMFYNCNSLNYIKMLGTTFGNNALVNFTNGVASSGTFVKHPNATIPTGTSGIPNGWTVQTATS